MTQIENAKNVKVLNEKQRKEFLDEGKGLILQMGKPLDDLSKRNLKIDHINGKIFHYLHDPFTILNAYTKISKNAGAMTKGVIQDEETMEIFGLTTAAEISKKIKLGKYKFKPVKRTWIPKPGKKKKRPIDVPTQSDRIVQEAVRGILEAIYEPEFVAWGKKTDYLSNNFGFRPQHSCWNALETIQKKSQRCTVVIEGDVTGAYNNVDHDILLSILQRRIKDKKFLELIKKMLKSGIMEKKTFEHSIIGTPQGGIVSPLLFNIYMFEFDKFIYHEIILPLQKKEEEKTGDDATKEYRRLRHQLNKAVKKIRDLKENENTNSKELQASIKKMKELRQTRNNQRYGNIENTKRKALYVRYADDWIFTFTGNRKEAEEIKQKISKYLKDHRKLSLDSEKTKITHVADGYTFLGFEIRRRHSGIKQRFVTQKTRSAHGEKYYRILKRTTSKQITIEPHSDRILKRLFMKGFCDKEFKPQAKPQWLFWEDFRIVEEYQNIMRGIYNYYAPCRRLTRLNKISYILQYSCAKTLARRHDKTLKQIFSEHGINLKIKKTLKNTKGQQVIRTTEFLTLTSLRKKKPIENDFSYSTTDPFRIRQYWRTKMKFYYECCICGSTDNIKMHHLHSIRNLKNKDRHQLIRSTIHRKQIPVCHSCHEDITHGRYNDPKKAN